MSQHIAECSRILKRLKNLRRRIAADQGKKHSLERSVRELEKALETKKREALKAKADLDSKNFTVLQLENESQNLMEIIAREEEVVVTSYGSAQTVGDIYLNYMKPIRVIVAPTVSQQQETRIRIFLESLGMEVVIARGAENEDPTNAENNAENAGNNAANAGNNAANAENAENSSHGENSVN